MSDEVLDWLSDELRKSPDDVRLKRLIKRHRAFLEKRGSKMRPPARTLEAARERILSDEFASSLADLKRNPKLPVDYVVRDLLADGTIIEAIDTDPFIEGREAVIDGCMWGDYYSRRKLLTEPSKRARAKLVLQDARTLSHMLQEFLEENTSDLIALSAPNSPAHGSVVSAINELRAAEIALSRVTDTCSELAATAGGSPGNPWRIGFIWGVGYRWRNLTGKKVSPSSKRFQQFVEQAYATLNPDERGNSDDWTSAIRTAVTRFGLDDDGRWIHRPGEENE